jgi:hypothetical protein
MNSPQQRYSDHVGAENDLNELQISEGILRRIFNANTGDTIELRRAENDHGRNHETIITTTNPTLISLPFFIQHLVQKEVIEATDNPHIFKKTEKKWVDDTPHKRKAPDFNSIHLSVRVAWEEMERETVKDLDIQDSDDLRNLIEFQLKRMESRITRMLKFHQFEDFNFENFLEILVSLTHYIKENIGLPLPTGKSSQARDVLAQLERFLSAALRQQGFNDSTDSFGLGKMIASELLQFLRNHPSNYAMINAELREENS